MCFSFFSLWDFSQKMLTCSILSQNGEGPDPIFLVIYTFYFNTMDRGRFSSHFLLSVDKMCFPSSVCESFLKKCWRAQFYLKIVKNWSDFFGDLSFQFQRPQRTGVDFLDTFFYPRVKCVFLLQAVRVFWKKAYVLNFISKWPIFLVIYPFNSNGQWSIFQPLPSYPGIKCVFPSSVCESFPKKCWRGQFYLKMAKAQTLPLGWFILSISMATMDRGRFSSHFLLSVDKMCFSFFSLWEFSQKMLTCTILSQNGEGPEPIFLVTYTFNFKAQIGTGSIFPPLPSIRR